MIRIVAILLLSTMSLVVHAQKLSVQDLNERGEMHHHDGYIPKSLESLVGSSTIIVKGGYGEVIGNRLFYGYKDGQDDTLENFADRHNMTEEEARRWAIPMTEYEIEVDSVLLGDIEDSHIILRKYEAAPADRSRTHPDVERIFFLVINPDNETYAVAGEASIQSNFNGYYVYDKYIEVEPGESDLYEQEVLSFVESTEARYFEEILNEEISRQYMDAVGY